MKILGLNAAELQIVENILTNYSDYKFWYYGSRVKGGFEKISDLDVLVRGKAQIDISTLNDIKARFDSSSLAFVVNLVDYYSITEDFYRRIEKDLVSAL